MPNETRHDERTSTGKKAGPPNLAHHLELCSWLDAATEGLCDAAKRRVGTEIRAHYAESVANALSLGRDEESAHRLALESLGDAAKARKMFRRSYLTEKQAAWLLGLVKQDQQWNDTALSMFPRFPWLHSVLLKFGSLVFAVAILGHHIRDGVVLGFTEARCWSLANGSSLVLLMFIVSWLRPWLGRRGWRGSLLCTIAVGALFTSMSGFYILASVSEQQGPLNVSASLVFMSVATVACLACTLFAAVDGAVVLWKLGKYVPPAEGDDDGGARHA